MRGRGLCRRWPGGGLGALAGLPLGAVLMLAGTLSAQEPRVRTALDRTRVRVGDRLELTVAVEHQAGETVLWPDSLSLAPFEILGAEVLPPEGVEEGVVATARFTLTVFELGDLELPGFELGIERPDGSSVPLFTDPYGVTVESVGLDEGGDIRAIRGPLGMPIGVIYVLGWLLPLLAVALVAYWLWRRRRGGEAEEEPRLSVRLPRLPHEEAYEALARLEASNLLGRGEIKEYHIVVSEIIRTYVEDRFEVGALEMTTREVIEALGARGLEREALEELRDFLEGSDLVKFAKLRPPPERCRRRLAQARRLVDLTRPRVEDFAAAQGEGAGGPGGAAGEGAGTEGSLSRAAEPGGSGDRILEPVGAEES